MSMDDDYDDYDDDDDESDVDHLYLTFAVGTARYAIAVTQVTEIVNLGKLQPIPDLPPYLRGVINLRGQVIPVVDVRLRLGLSPVEITRRSPAIILEVQGEALALLVDAVSEVLAIPESVLGDPPRVPKAERANSVLVKQVARTEPDITVILDVHQLAPEALELPAVQQASL